MKRIVLLISLYGICSGAFAIDWQVNTSMFQYSMEVFATVEIDGVLLSDAKDQLGAFVGDECRGVVKATDNPITGDKTFFLMIYANTVMENIIFKAYDSEKDQIIDVINTIEFETNTSVGSISSPYVMSNTERANGLEFIEINTDENSVPGAAIGYFVHYVNGDPVETNVSIDKTYDYNVFTVSGDTLRAKTSWNFEEKNSYQIMVTSSAVSGTINKEFLIQVTDVNEPPTAIYLDGDSVDENVAVGTIVGNLTVSDEDINDEIAFTLSKENALFRIDENRIKTKANINYELTNNQLLTVVAEDKGGNAISKDFVIVINDINDVPSLIMLSADSIPAGLPEYMTVGYFKIEDEDEFDQPDLSLSSNEMFILNQNNHHLITAKSFDSSDVGTQNIHLIANDGRGGVLESDFQIDIIDKGYSYTEKNVNVMFTQTDVYTHIFDVGNDQVLVSIQNLDNYGHYCVSANSLIINYKIYSISGQLITSKDVNKMGFNLDISSFEMSSYIINIYTDKGGIAEKLSFTPKC